jgi:hypothetical protein
MIFDIDENIVLQSIANALEEAGSEASDEQFSKIVDRIEESMPGVIQVIAHGMKDFWVTEARNAGGWGNKYAQAISIRGKGETSEVFLDKSILDKSTKKHKPFFMFAMMMEEGVKSWSIKKALLASEKAKYSKANHIKYIIVPFPVATPRREGQGKMSQQFGGREMTAAMYKIVKSGGKLPSGSVLPSGQNVSGLTKYITPQLHSGYGIFRMVSENSEGWQYPDIPSEPVFPSVVKEVSKKIESVISDFCKAIVREFTDK